MTDSPNPALPARLEEVPPDFERTEYRWRFAPRVPSGLALAQRLLMLPRVGPRFAGRVTRYYRADGGSVLMPGFRCLYGNLLVGRNVHLCDAFIVDYAPVVMYDGALLSWKNTFITSSHDFERDMNTIVARPIVLERNVWVTSGCTILGGVRIGENSVVAAGSVVTRSVPPNVLVGGNPARVLRPVQRQGLVHG
jgi:acetyltransferase-like isoleucine patch superfamily enzyme